MKTIIIAGIGAVGLALASGAALAQEHSHGAHDHAAATSMPTMAECHSMHEQMMGESSDHHDEASRQTMMENMDEGMRTRMHQCHEMMENMHDDGAADQQLSEGHDHGSPEADPQH